LITLTERSTSGILVFMSIVYPEGESHRQFHSEPSNQDRHALGRVAGTSFDTDSGVPIRVRGPKMPLEDFLKMLADSAPTLPPDEAALPDAQ
jgi:hypothetical protein